MINQLKWMPANSDEILRIKGREAVTKSMNDRFFYQQFLAPDSSFHGVDSTQTALHLISLTLVTIIKTGITARFLF